MNKLHKKIAINNELWLKRLASQVSPLACKSLRKQLDTQRVADFYQQAYFTPRAAAEVVLKLRRSECQYLARHIRNHERGMSNAHGSMYHIKWAMFIWVSVDRDLNSPRARAWYSKYQEFLNNESIIFTRF